MKYSSPAHICMLYQLLNQNSENETDGNFLASLNHFYTPFNLLEDTEVLVDLYKPYLNDVDELVRFCCGKIINSNREITYEIVEDLCRLHQFAGYNNDNYNILLVVAKEFDISDITTLILKDYNLPYEVKESIVVLYFMAIFSDNTFNGEEIQKLIHCPSFLRATSMEDLDEERVAYLQSEINNMGGYETSEIHIEMLCANIINSSTLNKHKILEDILSIIAIDGIDKMELAVFNKIALSFGYSMEDVDILISKL